MGREDTYDEMIHVPPSLISKIRQRLSGSFLYRPLRYAYNKVFLFQAWKEVRINTVTARFSTPSFKIVDDLTALEEKAMMELFMGFLKPSDIMWDVGANFGLYSLFAAQAVSRSGQVIAFEPERKSYSLLLRNIRENKLSNIVPSHYALSKESAVRSLYPSATANPGTHSFFQRTDYKVKKTGITVDVIPGDELVSRGIFSSPSVMKIDVEGAEYEVLLGMQNILRNPSLRLMVLEVHPNVLRLLGSNESEVEQLISHSGFSIISRTPKGTEVHLFCTR